MKIICIGRNYGKHIAELHNPTPEKPVVFMKAHNALLTDNKPFYYPNFSADIHYECELVLRICKNGKSVSPKFAHTYYDAVTTGIDFTARDLQQIQKEKGLPWEIAKAFDHSAVIGKWVAIDDVRKKSPFQFQLFHNDQLVQDGNTADVIFSFDQIIAYVSQFFNLNMGDLIFTGTPAGVGPINIGDTLRATLDQETLLQFDIK